MLATGPQPAVAIFGAALLGFGFSFPWASVAGTVFRETPDRERGSTVSLLSAFYDLFVGIGSFSAGIVSDKFGYSWAFLMAAGALTVSAALGLRVFKGVEAPGRERATAAVL